MLTRKYWFDPEDLENTCRKEETQGVQGLSKNYCRENVSPLSRLVRGLRNKYH